MSKLALNDVNIFYGDFHAVQNVNMQIPAQAVTAFIGPSGCGKSTVLRTINRMHEVIPGASVKGEILLDGTNIYGPKVDPVSVRNTIGMVFQKANQFPTMSIEDNLVAGLKLSGEKNKKKLKQELQQLRQQLAQVRQIEDLLTVLQQLHLQHQEMHQLF